MAVPMAAMTNASTKSSGLACLEDRLLPAHAFLAAIAHGSLHGALGADRFLAAVAAQHRRSIGVIGAYHRSFRYSSTLGVEFWIKRAVRLR